MRQSFEETVEYRLITCRKCLIRFYVPDELVTGMHWRDPVWCPHCGSNARTDTSAFDKLKHENAGLRGTITRMKKGRR
jgi:hypothetical protein